VNQLANAAATSSSNSTPGSTRAQAAAAFMKFSGISGAQSESEGEDPIREEDGTPSVEVAERMLKWHAEAIGRCVEMGPTSEV
jgi:hypothetical protein